jgi:hypothetical protein
MLRLTTLTKQGVGPKVATFHRNGHPVDGPVSIKELDFRHVCMSIWVGRDWASRMLPAAASSMRWPKWMVTHLRTVVKSKIFIRIDRVLLTSRNGIWPSDPDPKNPTFGR